MHGHCAGRLASRSGSCCSKPSNWNLSRSMCASCCGVCITHADGQSARRLTYSSLSANRRQATASRTRLGTRA